MRLIIWFLSLFHRKKDLLLPAEDIDEAGPKDPYLRQALAFIISEIDTGGESIYEGNIYLNLKRLNSFSYRYRSSSDYYPLLDFSAFSEVLAEFCKANGIKFSRRINWIGVPVSPFQAYIKRCEAFENTTKRMKCISQGVYR
jgi:hypothetical protein